MTYTRSAIGLLTRQYRSVLKKCFLINMGLFALGAISAANAAVADMIPAIGEDSSIRFIEGTSSNYNFITKDAAGTKYWLIQFDTDKLNANNTVWSTSQISGYTGTYQVTLPNGKTTTLYYKYTTPANYTTSSRITSLTSTNGTSKIFQNLNGSSDGGGIYNSGSGNYNIISDFINNSVIYSGFPKGGAIYNSGKINNIDGYFKGNYIQSSKQYTALKGGAISNAGTINNITGVFLDNQTISNIDISSGGSAIYNSGNIGTIDALFINNYSYSYGHSVQGVLRNEGGTINTVRGTFINNHIYSGGRYAAGGAIQVESSSTIIDIIGTFINNYTENSNSSYYSGGGAIEISGTINNIVGDFISNYAKSTSYRAQGGAITSLSSNSITKVTGNFIGNYTQANSNYSVGGAIYTTSSITNINNSNFIDNYALTTSTSGTAQGGAIWTSNSLTFNSTDGFNSIFSGNYVQKGTSATKLYEAIYANTSSVTLTFNATTNGQYTFDDYFNGVSNYKVRFTGDSSGKVNLYNDIKNGAVTTNTVTMNLANKETHDYAMYTLNSNANTRWDIDINLNSKKADTITTSASGSTGTVTLDDFNFIVDDFSSISPSTYKIQILKTQNSNLRLALSSSAQTKYSDNEYEMGIDAVTTYDEIQKNTSWNDTYNEHITGNVIYGTLGITTTSTTNDSIGVTITRVVSGETADIPMGDTLTLVNQSTLAERNFNAIGVTDIYNLTSTLGTTAAGTFTINGKTEDETHAVINLNNQDSFNLSENTTLNLNDIKLTGKTTVIDVSNTNAKVNILDSVIDGSIIGTEKFALKTSGTSTLNSPVTNTDYTNEGTTLANGKITGTVLNKDGATLNIKADNIEGTVTNNGTLNFTSGTNSNVINGSGITITTGTVINNAKINQAVANTGTLTSSAENLGDAILNANILNLSGALAKTITGNGTTNVNSTLALNSGANVAGTLNMNTGAVTVSNSAITSHNIGEIKGTGNVALDINYGDTITADAITVVTDTQAATLKITALNETGTRQANFEKQILFGTNGNTKLDVSELTGWNGSTDKEAEVALETNTIAYNA
ncbi:MAG: hypothetical protein VZR95_02435, partial [Alphaproteobacteria bacterium]